MQMTKDEMTTRISRIVNDVYTCNECGYTVSSLIDHLKNDFPDNGKCNEYVKKYTRFPGRLDIYNYIDMVKKIIVKFFDIDIQQNVKDPTDQVVYLAVEALVKAYGLKSPEELLEKVKELTGNSSNSGQPDVNQAFINVNDLITANTVLNSQVESLRAQISALGIKPIV